VKFYEARELAWVASFFPWVLLNEGMAHKQADTYDRVGWFPMAYIYLIKIRVTYESRPAGPRVKQFGKKAVRPKGRRFVFDSELLIHTINTVTGIVYGIKLSRTPISLQRISTVPVEKKFSKTRMHASVHSTAVELVKTMKDDEAMQLLYVQDQVKNRRLGYDETISLCQCLIAIGMTPLIDVESAIHIVKFPATISPLLGETTTDEFHIFV
jgi:hypothetical protein